MLHKIFGKKVFEMNVRLINFFSPMLKYNSIKSASNKIFITIFVCLKNKFVDLGGQTFESNVD